MKVLIVSSIMPPEIGGPASYVSEIVSRLNNKHQFRIITFTKDPQPVDGADIVAISQNGNSVIRQTRLLWEVFKKTFWADKVYSMDPTVVGLSSAIAGKILRKKTYIKYVGDPAWESAFGEGKTKKFLGNFLDRPDSGLSGRILILATWLTFRLADKIIVPSVFLSLIVTEKYKINESKVRVIYNAIETNRQPVRKYVKKPVYTVVSAGRLVTWKRIDGVIRAINDVNSMGKIRVRLRIIGDGPQRPSLESISGSNIEFLGRLSREETRRKIAEADLYILNSVYEGLPHTVIEAFSVGTPVIATDIPGTNEIAINNQTALTVKPENPADLAKAITRLMENPRLSNKLALAGAKLIASRFNWKTSIQFLGGVLGE